MNGYMNRYVKAAAFLVLALSMVTLAGCTSDAAKEGGMEMPEVYGYVTGARFAKLEVADRPSADMLVVKRVLVPAGSWIVVHLDDKGMPGDRVGLRHIPKGLSRNVEVPLKGVKAGKIIVSVHADKGTPDKFDFDMMKKTESPDRPFFVNNKELSKVVSVKTAGITAEGQVATAMTDQAAAIADGSSMETATADESSMDGDSPGDPQMDGGSDMEEPEDGHGDEDEGPPVERPAGALLGGFIGLNVGLIAFAGLLRRRGAKAKSKGGQRDV